MTDDTAGSTDDETDQRNQADQADQAVTQACDDKDEAGAGRQDDEPPLPPVVILAVVGLLCGFATIALVWLSERSCEQVRGTPNCGALGLPLLVLTVVISIVVGGIALGRLAMPQPRLVAFLGVVFMLLIVVGLLSDRLFSTATLVVVPVLTAVTFLLAHLVAGWLERADA
jgi:hypothetical protein